MTAPLDDETQIRMLQQPMGDVISDSGTKYATSFVSAGSHRCHVPAFIPPICGSCSSATELVIEYIGQNGAPTLGHRR